MAQHTPLKNIIKTVYFYLFSLIGLIIVTIGGIQLLNIGLKTYVFKAADFDRRISMRQPMMPYFSEDAILKLSESKELTNEEKASVKRWIESFNEWEKESQSIDYVASERSREAATSTAMILVGIPLFAYHWMVIRNELKKKDDDE